MTVAVALQLPVPEVVLQYLAHDPGPPEPEAPCGAGDASVKRVPLNERDADLLTAQAVILVKASFMVCELTARVARCG